MGVSPGGAAPVSSFRRVEGGIWPASRQTHTEMMLEAKASPADVALSPAADHKIWLKFSLRPLLIIFWDR